MTMREMTMRTIVRAICCLALLGLARGEAADAQPTLSVLQEHLPGLSGLIVQVDPPDTALAKAICTDHPAMVLLLVEAARAEGLREEVATAGLAGQVAVLPRAGTLVPLVAGSAACIITPASHGLPDDEIQRALGPRGVHILQQGGTWRAATKPVPATYGGWPQYFHDGAGTDVSTDTAVGPARGLQWTAGAQDHTTREKAVGRIGYRIASGLVVTSTSERLIARDARSGLPVWERPDVVVGQEHRYAFLIDAANQAVICYSSAAPDFLKRLDLRTGKDRDELVEGIRVLPEGWVFEFRGPGKQAARAMRERISMMQVRLGQGRIAMALMEDLCVLDAASGKRLWAATARKDMGWWHPTVIGDQVIVCEGPHRRSSSYTHWPMGVADAVVAFDLETGRERWRAQPRDEGLAIAAFNMTAHRGQVALAGSLHEPQARRHNVRMTVLDGGTGRMLHMVNLGPGHGNITLGMGHSHVRVMGLGDQWWINQIPLYLRLPLANPADPAGWQRDLSGFQPVACNTWRATPRFMIGGSSVVSVADGRIFHTNASRTDCDMGAFPGEGLLFESASGCACKPYLTNEKAFHSRSDILPWQGERTEAGAAKPAAVDRGGDPATDWPTYLRDPQRTAFVPARLGEGPLRELWRRPPPAAAKVQPMLQREWAGLFAVQGERVTGVSCAEGVAVHAEIHTGTVVALDPANGNERWVRRLGGRINSQPTIHQGMVLVGTRLGEVIALNRDNGQTIWSFRAAPGADLLVANGSLESVWPCIGSVTVLERGVFVTAGRHTDTDGGVRWYLLDPRSGAIRHQGVFGSGILEADNLREWGERKDTPNGSDMPPVSDGTHLMFSARQYRWQDGDWVRWAAEAQPVPPGAKDVREPTQKRYVQEFYNPLVIPGNPGSLWNGFRLAGFHQWSWGGTRAQQFAYRPDGEDFFTIGSAGPQAGRANDVQPRMHRFRKAAHPYPREVAGRTVLAGCDVVWDLDMPKYRGAGHRCIAATLDRVLVGATQDRKHSLFEIDAEQGSILHEHELPGSPIGGGISVAEGRVYVACNDGSIVCFGR